MLLSLSRIYFRDVLNRNRRSRGLCRGPAVLCCDTASVMCFPPSADTGRSGSEGGASTSALLKTRAFSIDRRRVWNGKRPAAGHGAAGKRIYAGLSFKHISFFTICCYNHKLKESVQESFFENGGKIHQYSGYARAFNHINCH